MKRNHVMHTGIRLASYPDRVIRLTYQAGKALEAQLANCYGMSGGTRKCFLHDDRQTVETTFYDEYNEASPTETIHFPEPLEPMLNTSLLMVILLNGTDVTMHQAGTEFTPLWGLPREERNLRKRLHEIVTSPTTDSHTFALVSHEEEEEEYDPEHHNLYHIFSSKMHDLGLRHEENTITPTNCPEITIEVTGGPTIRAEIQFDPFATLGESGLERLVQVDMQLYLLRTCLKVCSFNPEEDTSLVYKCFGDFNKEDARDRLSNFLITIGKLLTDGSPPEEESLLPTLI